MSADFDRDQLLDIFVAEAGDDMARFWQALHPEDHGTPGPADVADLHTVGHKLKGAALLYGFPGLGQLGALLEETLERVGEIPPAKWPLALEVLREIVVSFRTQVAAIGRGGGEDASVVEGFVRRCAEFLPAVADSLVPEPAESSAAPSDDYLIPVIDGEVLSYFSPEAEEYLHTIQTLLRRLERDMADADTIHQLYRVAHTLKGSAYTVGCEVVGDIAYPIETCMTAVREGTTSMAPNWIATIRHAVDVMRTLIARDAQQLSKLRQDVPCILAMLRELQEGEPRAEEVGSAAAIQDRVSSTMSVAQEAVALPLPVPALMGDQD